MPSFAESLNRAAETIKRPPPVPIGHYIMQVSRMPDPPEEMDTKIGKMEKLTVQCSIVAAHDDVDPDELSEYGNVAGVPIRHDFLFAAEDAAKFENSLNRLKNFCEHCGLDVSTGTLGEWLSQLPNAQFLGEVSHRMDPNDNEVFYAELRRTAPV